MVKIGQRWRWLVIGICIIVLGGILTQLPLLIVKQYIPPAKSFSLFNTWVVQIRQNDLSLKVSTYKTYYDAKQIAFSLGYIQYVFGNKRSTNELNAALQYGSRGERMHALGYLLHFPDQGVVPELIRQMNSEQDYWTKHVEAQVVCKHGNKVGHDMLVSQSSDTDIEVAINARDLLNLIDRNQDSIPPDYLSAYFLLDEKRDPLEYQRSRYILTPDGIKPQETLLLQTDYHLLAKGKNGKFHKAIYTMGISQVTTKQVSNRLIEIAGDYPLLHIRQDAMTVLASFKDHESVNPLSDILSKDTAPIMRFTAACTLGRIGDKAAVPALARAALQDHDPMNRKICTLILKDKFGISSPDKTHIIKLNHTI